MNLSLFNAAVWSAVLMCAAPRLGAADAVSDAVFACTAETNDARRLACFDALAAGLRGAQPATGPTAAAAAAAAATAGTAPTPQAAPAVAAAAATAPAAGLPGDPALSPEDRFGLRGELKREKTGDLTALSATATAISAKPRGELVISLDNGQVWAEIAPASKVRLDPGDPVRIEAGALGSYLLIAPNGRSSKVSRIR